MPKSVTLSWREYQDLKKKAELAREFACPCGEMDARRERINRDSERIEELKAALAEVTADRDLRRDGTSWICEYCDEYLPDHDTMMAHDAVCPNNPHIKRAEAAEAEVARLTPLAELGSIISNLPVDVQLKNWNNNARGMDFPKPWTLSEINAAGKVVDDLAEGVTVAECPLNYAKEEK